MLIPFALKYGLRPIYILSSAAQMAIMVWAARTYTPGDWWGVNALQCWVGSLAETMVQMTVADVFYVHQRGLMNSIYIWASNFGSSLAPVAAGFVTAAQGWRWVWWYMTIFFGLVLVAFIFGFEESKFDWTKAAIMGTPAPSEENSSSVGSKDQGGGKLPLADPEKQAQGEVSRRDSTGTSVWINPLIPRKTYWQRFGLATMTPGSFMLFARHAYQPFEILCAIPGVAYMSMVYAVQLAWSTVMSAALSTYMLEAPYGFDSTQIGLMNLAPFVGTTLGSVICGRLSDWTILKLAKRNGGVYEPEMRLWIFVPFIPFQVAGAFWFGYALQGGQSWVAVAFAWGMCSFGSAPISSIALTYMTDAYNEVSQKLFATGGARTQMLIEYKLDYRGCTGGIDLLPEHAEHHLCVCHDAVDRGGGHGECVQHDWRHWVGRSSVCICLRVEGQGVASPVRAAVPTLCGEAIRCQADRQPALIVL